MQNEWYRYTYYMVAPNSSAAAAGGNLTVNGFPTNNGMLTNDKRFVLVVMGPVVTGQARPNSTLSNYLEGANAATGALPRVFAWQVFSAPGNDRVAACPFTDGVTACN
jgi:hypothetical protein